MSTWTHACCEQCWIDRNAIIAKLENSPPGFVVVEGVRAPVMMKDAPLRQCCFCPDLTFLGIYVRNDPAQTPMCTCPIGEDEVWEDADGRRFVGGAGEASGSSGEREAEAAQRPGDPD